MSNKNIPITQEIPRGLGAPGQKLETKAKHISYYAAQRKNLKGERS